MPERESAISLPAQTLSIGEESLRPKALLADPSTRESPFAVTPSNHIRIFSQAMRRVGNIVEDLAEHPDVPLGRRHLTNVAMVQKTPDAINPADIMFAGEELPQRQQNGEKHGAEGVVQKVLQHELHAFVNIGEKVSSTIPPQHSERDFTFFHPGWVRDHTAGYRQTHETMYSIRYPSFTTGRLRSFAPGHKVTPRELSPPDFARLMRGEDLTTYSSVEQNGHLTIYPRTHSLVDSWQTNPDHQRQNMVIYDGAEETLKQEWVSTAYVQEVQTRMAVLRRLLADTHRPDRDVWREEGAKIHASSLHVSNQEEAEGFLNTYATFVHDFLQADEATYTDEYLRAIHRENFEQDMQAIQKSSMQKPFLLSHLICDAREVTEVEERHIRTVPHVNKLLAIACRITGVQKEDNPQWFAELEQSFREQSARADLNDILIEELCREFPIQKERVPKYMANVARFEQYFQQAIEHIEDPRVKDHFLRFWETEQPQDIAGMFSDMLTSPEDAQRRTAWRRLLLLTMQPTVERVIEEKKKKEYALSPFGDIVTGMEDQQKETVMIGKHRFDVCQMEPLSEPLAVSGLPLDLSDYRPSYAIRRRTEKDPDSIFRKLLERNGENSKGWFDFSGMQCVLQKDAFISYLQTKEPGIEDHPEFPALMTAWKGAMTKHLIAHMEQSLQQEGLAVSWMNVRATGDMKGILPEDTFEGSAASNVSWEWVKGAAVAEVDPILIREKQNAYAALTPEQQQAAEWTFELQLFPDKETQILKSRDDELVYAAKRLFMAHKDGRFPLALVFAWYSEEYDDLMKGAAKNGLLN